MIYSTRSLMTIDLTKLSEDELLDLNRRIIERLHFIRSTKRLTQLARFSVGMTVEFVDDNGKRIRGTIARLNRQTATIVAASGRWRVSPSLLCVVETSDTSAATASTSRVVAMPPARRHE